jgi:hypothetical protein
MRRVELPNGQWAMVRSPEEITTRGRRGIQAIAAGMTSALPKLKDATAETDMATLGFTEEEMDAVMRLQEATVVAFLAAWSLPDPVPTLASVGDLPATLYDALSVATAKDGADVAALSLDVSPGTTDGVPDPKEPSGASVSSDGPSKDSTAQVPTLT